jgi:hypothetical protein
MIRYSRLFLKAQLTLPAHVSMGFQSKYRIKNNRLSHSRQASARDLRNYLCGQVIDMFPSAHG